MKELVSYIVGGNFYKYSVYKVRDGKGVEYYIAEPENLGATIIGDSIKDLQRQADIIAVALNDFTKRIK